MAVLGYKETSQLTSIVGSDSSGVETNFVNASTNGDLLSSDRANTSSVFGSINVGTTAIIAKIGASNLAERKLINISHMGNGNLYWGTSNLLTAANGTQIFKNTSISISVGPDINIYLIATTATNDVRIVELA